MAHKNWDDIATTEFEAMDSKWQRDWADLRNRVVRRG